MSASDTVKEIMRVGNTAGIPRDFMEFLEEKCALLEGQIAALEGHAAELEKQIAQIKMEKRISQAKAKSPEHGDLREYRGALWKRTERGFEPVPYCKECGHHPVMAPQPHNQPATPMFWKCEKGHVAPFAGRPELKTD
jgi:hypothetical protein